MFDFLDIPGISLLADDRVRLSRMLAAMAVLFGTVAFAYCWMNAEFWLGAGTLLTCIAVAVGIWKLGNWWQLRRALRKAQAGMPSRQRGFEVVAKGKRSA